VIRTFALGCTLSGCVADGPRLESVVPEAARRGAQVELVGRGLCEGDCATAGGEVQLGLSSQVVIAGVLALADDSATIQIPDVVEIGRTQIVLTVNEHASNALDFEVLP
jgi:hypothetical protein